MQYLRHDIDQPDYVVYNMSDWHVGSIAFHEEAAKEVVQMVSDEGAFVTFGGDMIEGKKIDSPHFNPDGLRHGQLNIHDQCDAFIALMKPIADRLLLIGQGNHELYLMKDFDIVKYICDMLGVPECYGHYQSIVNLNNAFTSHHYHGRATMLRGAKDPIQKEANQKAWLKNRLHPLYGSAQAHYMSHTHQCMIVPPIEIGSMLDGGENAKMRFFKDEPREIDGMIWVPPDARWYVNTGTFRRGGSFGHVDYSEIAGYVPPVIACTKTTVEGNKIANIERLNF